MSPDSESIVALSLATVCEDRNFNVRIFYGDLDDLAIRLMTEGQREPITVRRDGPHYLIVDGHRRYRALVRARALRIETAADRYEVWDGERRLREAAGPVSPAFERERIFCRLLPPGPDERDWFSSQLGYNQGKPFTALERMIFVARLNRLGGASPEKLALETGLSRSRVTHALQLNVADPRLLDYVQQERISPKLALRLLRVFPPAEQMPKLVAALAAADRHCRTKILPEDVAWPRPGPAPRPSTGPAPVVDSVRARLHLAVSRLQGEFRFAANPAARERLATLMQVHQYAAGQLPYGRLEAYLLGRD